MPPALGARPWTSSEALWAPPVPQTAKNVPAVQETQVRSLSWEGPLREEMATHSSILAWRIPWTEETAGR